MVPGVFVGCIVLKTTIPLLFLFCQGLHTTIPIWVEGKAQCWGRGQGLLSQSSSLLAASRPPEYS